METFTSCDRNEYIMACESFLDLDLFGFHMWTSMGPVGKGGISRGVDELRSVKSYYSIIRRTQGSPPD